MGGAIYTRGNFNDVAYCDFSYNTARNGSAIYSRGVNLTIEDDRFMENQAFSYFLITKANPQFSYYAPTNKVVVNITHIGGDNIINAIYNDGAPENIIFYNVTYEHSTVQGDVLNTGFEKIHPVNGVDESHDGALLYQDSREDLQKIKIRISKISESDGVLGATQYNVGDVILDETILTGHWGNVTLEFVGLNPGIYSVSAQHPEDWLYTNIFNETIFEIVPQVDLKVTKDSDKDSYFVGETATYTINVYSLGDDATDVVLTEILPEVFDIDSFDVSQGEFDIDEYVWYIGSLNSGENATLTLKVKLTRNGTFTNTVNVSSYQEDINLTNNVANKTVTVKAFVDLILTKTVNVKQIKVGETVIWTITVKNNGVVKATNVKVFDKLSEALKYISHVSSVGNYDLNTGIWNIGELESGLEVSLNITTKALKSGKIVNNASVSCDENETKYSNNNDSAEIIVIDFNPLNNRSNNKSDNNPLNNDSNIDKNQTKNSQTNKNKDIPQEEIISNVSTYPTGNPIIIAFLALLIIVGVVFRKKN